MPKLQNVWDVIPDSGLMEREAHFWSSVLGQKIADEWKKRRVLVNLTPDQLISSTRRLNLGDGYLDYDLEKDEGGFKARHREMPHHRVLAGDPRIEYSRFDIAAYLDQVAAANNITERSPTSATGQNGVFQIGKSRVGQTSFHWIVVLNPQWHNSMAADAFLSSIVGEKNAGILLVASMSTVPGDFGQKHPKVVPLELPIDTMGIDPANYCTRAVLKFDEAKATLMATKKIVVNKDQKVIILYDRQLKVRNSIAKRHEFLIALLEHGQVEPQMTTAFALEHLKLDSAQQDVLQKVRSYKSDLREEFEELFKDDPETAKFLNDALLESEDAKVACKIDRDLIFFW